MNRYLTHLQHLMTMNAIVIFVYVDVVHVPFENYKYGIYKVLLRGWCGFCSPCALFKIYPFAPFSLLFFTLHFFFF